MPPRLPNEILHKALEDLNAHRITILEFASIYYTNDHHEDSFFDPICHAYARGQLHAFLTPAYWFKTLHEQFLLPSLEKELGLLHLRQSRAYKDLALERTSLGRKAEGAWKALALEEKIEAAGCAMAEAVADLNLRLVDADRSRVEALRQGSTNTTEMMGREFSEALDELSLLVVPEAEIGVEETGLIDSMKELALLAVPEDEPVEAVGDLSGGLM